MDNEQELLKIFETPQIRKIKRENIYKSLSRKHGGVVLCFVCNLVVSKHKASLEHIIPQSRGGTDELENLSISHKKCNIRRGNPIVV